MAVNFDTLNVDAKIFQELAKKPDWWVRMCYEPSFYIEVRKDNHVNVYFEGGSVARIYYCSKHKKLHVFTHHKYLGLPAPSKNNAYVEWSDEMMNVVKSMKQPDAIILELVISRIRKCYSQKHIIGGILKKENLSEKFIQGALITKSKHDHGTLICPARAFHLDSEFAYKDADCDIRIDLVRCDDGIVTFVELKRMSDGRMLHQDEEAPEIIEQMNRYRQFISSHSDELLEYYQKLYDIKTKLQLPVPTKRPTSINPEPQLLIFDNWEKDTKGRQRHRQRVRGILEREKINYCIDTSL